MGIRQARLEGPAGLQLTLFTGKAHPGTSVWLRTFAGLLDSAEAGDVVAGQQ
jgi:hypothetical protein